MAILAGVRRATGERVCTTPGGGSSATGALPSRIGVLIEGAGRLLPLHEMIRATMPGATRQSLLPRGSSRRAG